MPCGPLTSTIVRSVSASADAASAFSTGPHLEKFDQGSFGAELEDGADPGMVAIQGRVLGSYREQRVLCMRVADAAQRANDILKLVPVVQLRRKRVPRLEEAFRMVREGEQPKPFIEPIGFPVVEQVALLLRPFVVVGDC